MISHRLASWIFFAAIGCAGCAVKLDPSAPGAHAAVESGQNSSGPPVVEVTPAAAAAVRHVLSEQHVDKPCYLRVRVVPGGCQGFLHKLDLDPTVTADDVTFESGGVKMVVLTRQVDMLRGARVDYGREGDKEGFKVNNPNFEGEAVKKWLDVLQSAPVAE